MPPANPSANPPAAAVSSDAGCCTDVTVQVAAECVPDTPDLYSSSYTLSNACPTSQVASRTYFFEAAPTSSGPWDVILQSVPASRSYPPGDTTLSYYFGVPVYEPYHWFRVRVVVIEQSACWVREVTSTPAPLCASPSPTPTSTFTPTATATAVPCDAYGYNVSTGSMVRGTLLVPGSQCGSCNVNTTLPFPFTFYGQTYSSAYLGNQGTIQFASSYLTNTNACPMPFSLLGPSILPHWDRSLDTIWHTSCRQYIGSDCGIYTSVTGVAPNRVFNIEWRARYIATSQHTANFEARLYEGTNRFDFDYSSVSYVGGFAVVGVQDGGDLFTTFECHTWGSVNAGLLVSWYPPTCLPTPMPTSTNIATATPTATSTSTATSTAIATLTPTGIATITNATSTAIQTATTSATTIATVIVSSTPRSTATYTPTAPATPPSCTIAFTDVYATDYFYQAVEYLYCQRAVSGYADGTFRPYNYTTRGQLSKIVVLSEGWPLDTAGGPHFSDVQAGNPFYPYIETAYNHSVISGYADNTFRWGNNVTRGQLSKIAVLCEGWTLHTSRGPHFSDVPPDSVFYDYVETAYHHSIISGYSDGSFLPANNATRGQISKIVYNAATQP